LKPCHLVRHNRRRQPDHSKLCLSTTLQSSIPSSSPTAGISRHSRCPSMPDGVPQPQDMLSTAVRGAQPTPRSFESLHPRSRHLKGLMPVVAGCVPEFGSSFFQTMRASGTPLRTNLARFACLLASCSRGKTLCFGLLAVSSESFAVLFGSP